MNIKFLEAFIWIARLGSFRSAADRLNLTQATISSRISTLEEDFQTRLFDRGAREVKLTAAGRLLLNHAEKVLEVTKHMQQAMRSETSLAGRLRIGVVETIAHTWLLQLLGTIYRDYPALEIELTSEPTLYLHEHLRRGLLDVALQTDAMVGEGLRNMDLGLMPMTWIGPPGSKFETRVQFAEIVASPVITMSRGSQPHVALLDACQREGLLPNTIHCVSSLAVIMELVKSRMGFALVPRAPIQRYIDDGALSRIESNRPLPNLRLVTSYRVDPTSDAASVIAEVARAEADRYAIANGPDLALVVQG